MTVNFFIFLCLSFAAYSAGDPLCGPESCNDLATVKTCKNVQYCISHVWSKRVHAGFKDNVCKICLEMVKEARDQLQSNETQEEIKQVLEGSCKLLVVPEAVKICKELADKFEPELVQMLAAQMDPETVCAVAKLCFNSKLREEQLNSNECVTCQRFVTSAAEVIVHSPEPDLMNQLINICRSMSSYSDACMFSLLQDPISIMNLTRNAIMNQPCEAASFCPVGGTPKVEKIINENVSWQESKKKFCYLCPAMMGYLHNLMDELGTDANLMHWTHDLCTSINLPRHACKTFVRDHYKLLYSYFESDVNYDYICTYGLGLCSKHSELPPMWPLLPVSNAQNSEESDSNPRDKPKNVRVIKPFEVPKMNKVKLSYGDPLPDQFKALPVTRIAGLDSTECSACTNVFTVISQYISTHEDYVDSILNNTCSDANNFDECMAFNKEFGYLFKNSSHIDSEQVCPSLVPFCDGKSPTQSVATKASSQQSCKFCVNVLDSLNSKSPRTEATEVQVTAGLKELCKKVPTAKQMLCNQVAENYLKNIVTSVTSDMDSIDTCGYLKLCDQTQTKDLLPQRKKGGYCQSCMLVVQTIYDQLNDGTGKTEIQDILRSLCGELPSKAKSTCYLMIDMYSDELIKLLEENLNPDVVCTKLHFCSATHKKAIVPIEAGVGKSKIPCNFCLTAVNLIISQLQDNKTEEEIRKALNNLCSYMPDEVKDTCVTLISEYTEDLIDMIIADFNATEICIYLKMCGPKFDVKGSILPEQHSSGFSIATNEIWRKYNPKGACHFCRLIEKSMSVAEYGEKGAGEMFGLLSDVCLMDSSSKYEECARKFSNDIVPFGKRALLGMTNICEKMQICSEEKLKDPEPDSKILGRIRKAVEECAMCEGMVGIVVQHMKLGASVDDFAGNSSDWCSSMPKDKQKMCQNMLTSYAPSVVNLLTLKSIKEDEVCFEVKLCDRSALTKVNMAVTSVEQNGLKINNQESNACLRGPSFWCASLTNARKCGTVPHCRETIWKTQLFV